jgi:two-component system NtrC family response regulator
LIKKADGGTLFLDEVGEMPLSLQKSFLRVLQERRFRRVGGKTELFSDFRLIAATNRNLDEMVKRRQFRKDLLFRLRSFSIELPPLRQRLEDIKEIVLRHTRKLCDGYGISQKDFSPEFFDVLSKYHWPGNVRELVNAIERAVSAARREPIIFPKHLPTHLRVQLARSAVKKEAVDEKPDLVENNGIQPPLPRLSDVREAVLAEAEQRYLQDLIHSTGSIEDACQVSGLSRSRIYTLLKKYNVSTSPK